jgi:hypothetical protein
MLTQLGTTGDTALSLFYTLYNSPLHTLKGPQSSLVVSWQRIYPGLTVTPNDTWSLFTIYEVTPCHYSAAASSEDSTQFNSKLISRQAGIPKLDYFSVQNQSSRSHIATDGHSVSLGVESHLGSWQDIYYCLIVTVCYCGSPFLTRGRVLFCSAEHFPVTTLHGPNGKHSLC